MRERSILTQLAMMALTTFVVLGVPFALAGAGTEGDIGLNVVEIQSTYVEVGIAPTGNFTMGTLEGDPNNPNDNDLRLLFGHPSSTTGYTTMRVDGSDATMSTGTTLPVVTPPTTVGGVNTTVWEYLGVRLTQRVTLVTGTSTGRVDTACLEYTMENIDATNHDVGLRILFDTQLGNNDGAPFQVPGLGAVTTESELLGANVPQAFQVFDDLANPNVIASGTLGGGAATLPDRAVWGHWSDIFGSVWDYTISPGTTISDSAVAHWWNPTTLAPGATRTIITYYGLGSVTTSTGPLVVGLTAPAQLVLVGGVFSPNPFTATGFIENSVAATGTANGVQADLMLPAGLELDAGQTNPVIIGNLAQGANAQANWQVRANGAATGDLTMTLDVSTTNLTPASQTVDRVINIPGGASTIPVITEIRQGAGASVYLNYTYNGPGTPLLYAIAMFDWATGAEGWLDLGGPGDPWLLNNLNTTATVPVPGGGYYTAFVAAIVDDEIVRNALITPISNPGQALVIAQPGLPIATPPTPTAVSPAVGTIDVGWGLQRALGLVAITVFDYTAGDFLRDASYTDEIYRLVDMWPGVQPGGTHPTTASYTGLPAGQYAVQIFHLGWDGSVSSSAESDVDMGTPRDGWIRVQVE